MYEGNAYNEDPPTTRADVIHEILTALCLSGAAIPMFVYLLLEAIL